MDNRLNFGDIVKHKYSPYQGKITGIAQYASGVTSYLVTSDTLSQSGNTVEEWFNHNDVEVVD